MLDELVRSQHGVVTRQQLLTCGVTPDALRARMHSGRWQRLHRGTYATFSGEPPRLAQLWAAVLYAGAGAALSHQSAAELHRLVDPSGPRIHLTVPSDRRVRPARDVVVHLSRRVPGAIHPTHRPPRIRLDETVLDLAACSTSLDEALGWLATACGRRLTTPARLRQALVARNRVPWRPQLVAALADLGHGVQSLLELKYLRGVERAHGLPAGIRQAIRERSGGRYYDDVLYPHYRLSVELDGRVAHTDESRFRDLRRDNCAVAAGGVVLRYGWADVTGCPCAVAAQVATVLRHRGWPHAPRPCSRACVIMETLRGYRTPKSS